MHDAILTALKNEVLPQVEMVVKSITESSGRETNSMVQNSDQRDFTGNTENTALILASSWLDLNVDQVRNEETHYVGIFKEDDFPALRPYFDRKVHTRYTNFAHLNL